MPTECNDIVVFLGPSLPVEEARALLSARYLPPVQQGAVYEAAQRRPRAIAIIDGYFGWVPSVWHKEILWALAEGIPVFGAASMGALRAAELHGFGMTGHGTVFRDFASGRLEDDDEVAIVHTDASDGFRPLSEAMVNIRYTLADARSAGVISPSTAETLLDRFKGMFYPDRRMRTVLAAWRDSPSVPPRELERLLAWLPSGYRDVKREDTVSLLRTLAAGCDAAPGTAFSPRDFQPTVNWTQLTESVRSNAVASEPGSADAGAGNVSEEVLAECRLAGRWPAMEALALARLLVAHPPPQGSPVTEEEYHTELARLCLSLGVEDLEGVLSWLDTVGWDSEQLSRVVQHEALLQRVREYWRSDLARAVREVLVIHGHDAGLAARAWRKRAWMQSRGGRAVLLAQDPADALAWFRNRLGVPDTMPESVLAMKHGWDSVSDLREDVLCEYQFQRAGHASDADL